MKIIFILSAILLIKQSLGGAIDTSTSLTPAVEAFGNAVISKLAALAEEPIKLSKKVLEDTYADNLNHQNSLVSGFIAGVMIEFEKVDLDTDLGKISAFLSYFLLFDLINGVVIGDEDEREMIQAVKVEFDKHNITGVANAIQRTFDEFLEWLTHELETKSDKLTSQELMRVKALKELCQQFKDEINYKKMNDEMAALMNELFNT